MRRRVLRIAALVLLLAGCAGASQSTDDSASTTVRAGAMNPAVSAEPSSSTTPTTTTTTAVPVVETSTTTTAPPPIPCTGVVHLGDSTSVGMTAAYLPATSQIGTQYTRVGVAESHLEIDGARSIVETHHGSPNARDRAAFWREAGYQGCWVFALGTTDAANVGAGSNYDATTRIDRMMAVAGGEPVLWVTVKTLVPVGAWSNANMQIWNEALAQATTRYPNTRVLDWNALAKDTWFASDGIHYTAEGYAERARLIADALGQGFPPH